MSKKLDVPVEFALDWAWRTDSTPPESLWRRIRPACSSDDEAIARTILSGGEDTDKCRAAYRSHMARQRKAETLRKSAANEAVTPIGIQIVGHPRLKVWHHDTGTAPEAGGRPVRRLLVEPEEILRLADEIRDRLRV